MALTEHQEERLYQSLGILSRGSRLLIRGSAGVGKTFMVNMLIKELAKIYAPLENQYVYCSAPTNKAVAVLRDKVEQIENLSFITTHAALKLKRQIDFKTGDISFKPNFDEKYPPLKGVKVLIIDETSMINSELLDYIEEHATRNSTKVVFIGDDKQLNPVGETVSPVFVKNYPEVELTEIIRQKGGNPIIDLSRNLIKVKSRVDNRTDIGGYIYSQDKDRVIETLAAVNGTDDLKYLAYTNREVDTINKLVRERIYGNPKKIEEGETLVFNAPFGEKYFTNEEILVRRSIIREKVFPFMVERLFGTQDDIYEEVTLKYYSINYTQSEISNPDGTSTTVINDDIIVVHEDSEEDYKAVVKQMKDLAKAGIIAWVEYYGFIEQFADMKYNHAITVHKSQGSTYKKAIVNVRNINMNNIIAERNRLLYTAVTRASELLILYNV